MKDLAKSFVYAFNGIIVCIKKERNMRIHLTFCAYMFYFLGVHDWFEVTRTQYAILFVICAAVIGGELVNTAIERAVDHASTEITEPGRIAKDCAAGAVLVSAVFAVECGIAILWQPDAFRAMFAYYKEHLYFLAVLIVCVTLSVIFIFKGIPGGKKDK